MEEAPPTSTTSFGASQIDHGHQPERCVQCRAMRTRRRNTGIDPRALAPWTQRDNEAPMPSLARPASKLTE